MSGKLKGDGEFMKEHRDFLRDCVDMCERKNPCHGVGFGGKFASCKMENDDPQDLTYHTYIIENSHFYCKKLSKK